MPPGSIAVLAEPGRQRVTEELLGAAARLGGEVGAAVHALCPDPGDAAPLGRGGRRRRRGAAGADLVLTLRGSAAAEDVADALAALVRETAPWAVLAPSTAFGREVAGRAAAATGSGLVGDAIALVGARRRPGGRQARVRRRPGGRHHVPQRHADGHRAPGRAARPGRRVRSATFPVLTRTVGTRGRVRVLADRRDDDVETLARAPVVIGVGTGVTPEEYEELSPLAAVLGAELAATRKVTDRGWAPRSRQVGITGRSIAPRLYVAVGLSGKFNHMVGVRAAGTILAVNADRDAPVFEHCDVGIVGDWHQVVPLLHEALRRGRGRGDDRATIS